MNIADIIFEANGYRDTNIAIHDEQGSLTYQRMHSEVLALVETLRTAGVGKGMGVGVMGKNSRQFIMTVLAVLKLEAIVMPISNQLKTHEVNVILDKAKLNFLLSDDFGPVNDATFVRPLNVSDRNWTLNKHRVYEGVAFAAHVSDAAIVRYTSGTTGEAKGVIIGHGSINDRLDAANACLQLGDQDVVIWVLQMSYHFVVSILLYLKYGCAIVVCKNFLADTIFNDANTFKGTFLYASPLHIRLLTNLKHDQKFNTINRVISTSTAISKAQCDAFYNKYQLPITQAYGIIEIGLPIINYDKGKEEPDAVGKALDNFEVAALDENNGLVPTGEIGHLAIRGPGMFDAYLAPPILRAEILNDGWFMTGDLASIQDDGMIKVEGRKKSMINVAGNKVFPLEVEQVMNMHPQIQKSRVSGYQHRLMGEIVQAEIMVHDNAEIDTEKIIDYCRERLSTYKIPQRIIVVEDLPMTDSGKLVRH